MAKVDAEEHLYGQIQMDDAGLGCVRPGVGGRSSPGRGRTQFAQQSLVVAAVSTNSKGHPMRVKVTPMSTFSSAANTAWARINLTPGSDVSSDGLPYCVAVVDAGSAHSYVVVGRRKPRELPQCIWDNTVLGNLKTLINGAYKAFKFRKYAHAYLGAFVYRFNRRFDLRRLLDGLIGHPATSSPVRERQIWREAEDHD